MRLRQKQTLFILLISFFSLAFIPKAEAHRFLNIASDARAVGMGEAYIALPDDVNIMNYNPSGLGFLNINQLSFMHIEWLVDMQYEYTAYAHPIGKIGTAGVNFRYLHYPAFDYINSEGNSKGKINGNDIAATLGFGTKPGLPGIDAMGINIKYIKTTLEDYDFESAAVDIGLLQNHQIFNKTIYSGFAIRNIGINYKKIGPEPISLPMDIAFGVSSEILNVMTFNYPFSITIAGELVSEIISKEQLPLKIHFGIETSFLNDFIFLRYGNKFGYSTTDFCFSIGITHKLSQAIIAKKYKITDIDLELNYAIVPYENMGINHYISLNIKNLYPSKASFKEKPVNSTKRTLPAIEEKPEQEDAKDDMSIIKEMDLLESEKGN